MSAETKKFSVKELAEGLGVSRHYVYQMRACGFEMPWEPELHCHAASLAAAQEWIRKMNFRMYCGLGRVTPMGMVIKRS